MPNDTVYSGTSFRLCHRQIAFVGKVYTDLAERKIKKVSGWIQALCVVALVALSIFDLSSEESVPLAVMGIIGGIALGVDGDSIPSIIGVRKKNE